MLVYNLIVGREVGSAGDSRACLPVSPVRRELADAGRRGA